MKVQPAVMAETKKMALGVGVASIRSDANAQEDSFGLVALCSVGPILAVLLLSFVYRTPAESTASSIISNFADTVALGRGYVEALPHYLAEVLMALLPIVVFFLIFQVITLKLRRVPFLRIMLGLGITLSGLVLFLTGVNVGFMPIGYKMGHALAQGNPVFLTVFGLVMGVLVVLAEPAIHVLNQQVEDVTGGYVTRRSMMIGLCCGVGAAMVFI